MSFVPRVALVLSFAWVVPCTLAAQEPVHGGLPGKRPGTERWIVELRNRSFDLAGLAAAIRGGVHGAAADVVATLDRACARDQQPVVTDVERLGGAVIAQYWIINALAIEIEPKQLDAVRRHPRVLRLWPDAVCEPTFIKTSTNAKNHRVDALHSRGVRGKGRTIAIMDTGLDANMSGSGRPHRSFFVSGDPNNKSGGGIAGSRILANRAFGALSAEDANGHGTGVAGIAAGEVWLTANGDAGHAPLASIAGYGISNTVSGRSDFVTIAKAWQAIAADRQKLGIAVANNSFSGSPDPLNPSQQALDTAARVADILVCVSAGNEGAMPRSTQSAANGLAVAAVHPAIDTADDHRVASFSSRGPVPGDRSRFYPDIAANGVDTYMPRRDAETSDWKANGTSMASPQVAGAACLFRSVATSASALETKAALLAATDSIAGRNAGLDRNAYGTGYLRDDRLLEIAQGKGVLETVSLTKQTPDAKVVFQVKEDRYYAVAIAWHRHDVTRRNWSNVDLRVEIGGNTQGISATPRNLYEKVVFRSVATGGARIVVRGVELEQDRIPVAVAAIEVPRQPVPGAMVSFGSGCEGTGETTDLAIAVPSTYGTRFGSSDSLYPFGGNHRMQQVYAQSVVPSGFAASSLFFRHDDQKPTFTQSDWVEIEVKLGAAKHGPSTMSTRFSDNPAEPLVTVFTPKVVNLPLLRTNQSARDWRLKLPFDRTFVWSAKPGRWLLLETVVGRSSRGLAAPIWVDAHEDTTAMPGSRIVGLRATSTIGGIKRGIAIIAGFGAPTGAVPRLRNTGVPTIGKSYRLELDQGPKGSAALLLYGLSAQRWNGLQLPLDLAPFGAPGCSLLTSVDVSIVLPLAGDGTGSVDVPIPNATELVQLNVFHQMLVLDPLANRLGFTVSNGLGGAVGG